jgi:small-conductance mechanosensitive channel
MWTLPTDWTFYGNTVQSWLLALLVALIVLLVLQVMRRVLAERLTALARITPSDWGDSVARLVRDTRFFVMLAIALYAGSLVLEMPEARRDLIRTLPVIALLFQGAIWGNSLIAFILSRSLEKNVNGGTTPAATGTILAVGFICRLLLWTLVFLLALDNFGVNITALVAGLGIGGIAVAFAAQNILSDLFASLSILFDKPFIIGDAITVDPHQLSGTVEHIGLKTTRIRSQSGELVVIANGELLKSRIRNFRDMHERRVTLTVRLEPDTPLEQAKAVPEIIRELVMAQGKKVSFERAHLKARTDTSLDYEAQYLLRSPNYVLHLDIQQALQLALMERFSEAGIRFYTQPRQEFPSDPGGRSPD